MRWRVKLLRLLLIQVQLLKTELLKAMGALDDLVDANRLNMQLLASVPAVVLFGAGWRKSVTSPQKFSRSIRGSTALVSR